MQIYIKKLRDGIKLPTYANPGDAGMDIYTPEAFSLEPGERKFVPVGFAVQIPDSYVLLAWGKSSLAAKAGIDTMGGVIDSGYRGEIFIGLVNVSNTQYHFEAGDKIAQLLLQQVSRPEIFEVQDLENSDRGEDGFGSTGKK
jgi:dUTP pyrophosphatase